MGRINKYNIAKAALLVVAAYLEWWSIVIITSALLLFIGCLFLAEYYSTKDRDLLPPAGLVFTGGLAVLGSLAFGDSSLAAASFAILIGLGVVVIFKSYWESKQLRDKLR